MSTERYFIYGFNYEDEYKVQRKLISSFNNLGIRLSQDDESIYILDRNNLSLFGKTLVICKVSINEINNNTDDIPDEKYNKLTYNDRIIIPVRLKKVFESQDNLTENLKTKQYNIEYLIISNLSEVEYSEEWKKYNPNATNDEKILTKIITLLNYYTFKTPTTRNNLICDVIDLLDKVKLRSNFDNNTKFLDLLESISNDLNEQTLANIWKSIFKFGIYGNNILETIKIPEIGAKSNDYVNNLFDTGFTNFTKLCNNANNGNLFHKTRGMTSGINIHKLFNTTAKYRLITSYYYENELNELTVNDIVGTLIGRKNSTNPKNFTCLKHRHFMMDYEHSNPDEDDLIFNINGFNYINTLIKNMAPDLNIFKIKIQSKEENATTMGCLFNLDVYILKDYYNRIITSDNLLNPDYKSITKFIMHDDIQKISNICWATGINCSNMLGSAQKVNGEYYPPGIEIKEFPAVTKHINAKLFSYQKRNISWMDKVERDIRNKTHTLDTIRLGVFNCIDNRTLTIRNSAILEYTINNNNFKTLALDNGKNIILPPNINNKFELSGGILADEVGLGKTLTIISHLVNQYERDKADYLAGHFDCDNLIIIPSRLLNQWQFEIEKYVPSHLFNVVPIATINDMKKYSTNKHQYDEHSKQTPNNVATGGNTTADAATTQTLKKGKFEFPGNLSPDGKLLVTKLIDDLGDLITTNVEEEKTPNVDELDKTFASMTIKEARRSPHKKMDIVIMSSNMLANKNYFDYLATFEKNQSNDKYDYHTSDYIDIFKMKWNRIIVDEAHERILVAIDQYYVGDYDARHIAYTIINVLKSRYRWAMTATPFEKNLMNGLAYLNWFISNTKMDLETIDVDYSRIMTNGTLEKIFGGKFNNFMYFVTEKDLINLQKMTVIKTTKKSVSAEINIPIFTEEVITMNLSQIERNIYRNAETDQNNHSDRIRRLFQLCTNICVSSIDIEKMGIDPNAPVTLEQLNSAMINNFSKLTQNITAELDGILAELPLIEKKSELSKKIQADLRLIEPLLAEQNLDRNTRIRHVIECMIAHEDNPNRTHYGIFEEIDKKAFKLLRKELYAKLLDCEVYSDAIIGIAVDCLATLGRERPTWDEYKTFFIIDYLLGTFSSKSQKQRRHLEENIAKLEREKVRLGNQIKLFENNDFIKEKTNDPCSICWSDFTDESKIAVTPCRHVFCGDCFEALSTNKASFSCPECRSDVVVKKSNITTMLDLLGKSPAQAGTKETADTPVDNTPDWKKTCISKYGTKMAVLVEKLQELLTNDQYRVIIFSQYDMMLRLIGKTLNEFGIKNIYAKGNVRVVNKNIDTFKRDSTYRVIMLSSEHSNSGSNLTEASHIILVDVLNMDAVQTKQVEAQAIGRAVRLGQQKPVKVIRLITNDTVESVFYERNKYDIMSVQ